jgi:hypothetical protein
VFSLQGKEASKLAGNWSKLAGNWSKLAGNLQKRNKNTCKVSYLKSQEYLGF